MIDAKQFGAELAGIVKAATVPLIARLDALEKRLDGLPMPQDGKDADPDAVAALVRDQIKGDLDSLREAGKGVSLDDVAPLIDSAVEKAVSQIEPAKDGIGLAGALIDRDGNLVVTLTNGVAKALGPVVGKDAEPAEPGRDGLGFEDLEFETKDGRLYAVFRRGDLVKEARLPGISYRGVWKAGEYLTGDSVTFGACQWIATADTDEKPGEGKAWQLAVRKGRDAKPQVKP
ncbi:MAG TPA: hypothetical protein GX700_16730 [Paracoccus sp.]|nr:hypothetical protein [Paracoccus sp. (in: a-proteobacteria)]